MHSPHHLCDPVSYIDMHSPHLTALLPYLCLLQVVMVRIPAMRHKLHLHKLHLHLNRHQALARATGSGKAVARAAGARAAWGAEEAEPLRQNVNDGGKGIWVPRHLRHLEQTMWHLQQTMQQRMRLSSCTCTMWPPANNISTSGISICVNPHSQMSAWW